MPPTIHRRRFLTTAGLATGGAIALPFAPHLSAQKAGDPVNPALILAGKEFARLYKHGKSGRPLYSEHFQSAAANFRLFAATLSDDLVKQAARDRRPIDHHAMHLRRRAETKRLLGVDIDEPEMPVPSPDEQARIRAQIAKEGLAPTLLRIADMFDARAAQVARNGGRGNLQNVQDQNPWCTLVPSYTMAMSILCNPIIGLIAGANVTLGVSCVVAWTGSLILQWVC